MTRREYNVKKFHTGTQFVVMWSDATRMWCTRLGRVRSCGVSASGLWNADGVRARNELCSTTGRVPKGHAVTQALHTGTSYMTER